MLSESPLPNGHQIGGLMVDGMVGCQTCERKLHGCTIRSSPFTGQKLIIPEEKEEEKALFQIMI